MSLSEKIKHTRHFDGLGMGDQELERDAKALEARIAELERERDWLRKALSEIRDYGVSQPAALNVPEESWERMRSRGMEHIAYKALEKDK